MQSVVIILDISLVALCLINGVHGDGHTMILDPKLDGKYTSEQNQILSQMSDDDKLTGSAIRNIAYFLRNYKFNEWDRRYYQKRPNESQIGFYGAFPTPSLRSKHWDVKAHCNKDFHKCINYLQSIIETAPYSRVDDAAVAMNENPNAFNNNIIQELDKKCKEVHNYAQKIGAPFDDPSERFQWLTTASYYMCWYTMLGVPALSMIGESCDNFANCLNPNFGTHNHDPRSDDKLSFACAMYSFCPDACCPIKYVSSIVQCYDDKRNPCFTENGEGSSSQRQCKFDRKYNKNLKDIATNWWNISCNCKDGFMWKSESGMCVDVDECLTGIHKCDIISENCLNLPGTFRCVCKWGYDLRGDKNQTVCIKGNFAMSNKI